MSTELFFDVYRQQTHVMNHATTVLFIALSLCTAAARAQQQADPQQPPQPKTKLEQFQAKTGSVVIMGYGDVGTVSGQFGVTVFVEVREFTDAASGAKQSGVLIKIKEGGRLERDASAYIDADEIDSLIKGIDYIAGLTKTVTRLPSFQADYRTKGELNISTFTNKGNEISAAIKAGRFSTATAYVSLADLAQLRKHLQSSLTALQAIKAQ